jgi:hypothetical protein
MLHGSNLIDWITRDEILQFSSEWPTTPGFSDSMSRGSDVIDSVGGGGALGLALSVVGGAIEFFAEVDDTDRFGGSEQVPLMEWWKGFSVSHASLKSESFTSSQDLK